MRFAGKLYRRALGTSDYKLARRKLADFRNGFERTDTTKGKTSLGKTLDAYKATLTGAASTLEKKRAVAAKPRQTWFGCDSLPLRTIAPSQVTAWLSQHYGSQSPSYYNAALSVIRTALEMAVKDRIIAEKPGRRAQVSQVQQTYPADVPHSSSLRR